MNQRISLVCLVCLLCALAAAGCGSGSGHDPSQAELQALVDRALDVTDLACPAVEESAPFLKRASNPIYKVNEGGGSISVTQAGVLEAAMMALDAVETGMFYPDLQQAVDARMPHEQVAEARTAADAAFQRLLANRKSYGKECAALLDSYADVLVSLDKLEELTREPGKNTAFYLQYAIARELYMLQLEKYSAAVERRGDPAAAGAQYQASRERYLQAAADYMMALVRDLTRGEGDL